MLFEYSGIRMFDRVAGRFDAGRRIVESSGPGARGLVVDLSYGPAPRARCAMEKK